MSSLSVSLEACWGFSVSNVILLPQIDGQYFTGAVIKCLALMTYSKWSGLVLEGACEEHLQKGHPLRYRIALSHMTSLHVHQLGMGYLDGFHTFFVQPSFI